MIPTVTKYKKTIQCLNPNKAHGHDGVSVRTLKLSCSFIIKPLLVIFSNCINLETFPGDRKKDKDVPVYKKSNKPIAKNYQKVFLLPICSKIFEKIVFEAMSEFMIESKALSQAITK